MNISLDEIGKFLGAELRNFAPGDDIVLRNVLTDSRADLHGALFVALKGENFDAHNFLDKAVEAWNRRGVEKADAKPVKRGEWGKRAYNRLQCSYCGKCEDIATDFCPNCGADMREPTE